jgi:hypothetical protein
MLLRRHSLERILARAERSIALLDRCRALNAASERERLLADWRRGRESRPAWIHARGPDLRDARAALDLVADRASAAGAWGRLYAERAAELAAEAAIADALGRPEFTERAARRFPLDRSADGADAEAIARAWCAEPPPPEDELDRHRSDDESDPESLISALRRAVGIHRLPFRVVISAELPCAAATGDGVLLVRAGVWHSPPEVRRITLHEIEAHAMPRMRARGESLGLYRVGTARGSDDEEGRALILEERAGLLDARRKHQLARRHRATIALRHGADWVETVRLLRRLGASLAEAIDLACRAHRGGGLGREIVYLTARARVLRALERDPEIESWMARGRISVDAAPILRSLGKPPEHIEIRTAA